MEKKLWVKATRGNGVNYLMRVELEWMFMTDWGQAAPPSLLKSSKGKLTNTSNRTGSSPSTSLVRSFQLCHGCCCMKLWVELLENLCSMGTSDAVWSSQKHQMSIAWNFIERCNRMHFNNTDGSEMLDHILTWQWNMVFIYYTWKNISLLSGTICHHLPGQKCLNKHFCNQTNSHSA